MPKRNHLDDKDSSDEGSASLVNVDFDFFDPASIDYIAIKRLLSQLFQADAELLQTHELTELIISQPLLGTTVKTDGIDSDPFAFLTVLNMNVHRNNVAINAIIEYLLAKTAPYPALHDTFMSLFNPSSTQHVGLILSERLINMPVQVAPHMYRLLCDEIKWALDENEPYSFSHYLCISRTYKISLDEEHGLDVNPHPSKKLRSQQMSHDSLQRVLSYHAEDEIWEELSSHTAHYEFSKQAPREPGVAGADVAAKVMLLPAARFPELVASMGQRFAP